VQDALPTRAAGTDGHCLSADVAPDGITMQAQFAGDRALAHAVGVHGLDRLVALSDLCLDAASLDLAVVADRCGPVVD
jgi:hypothetical protein